MRHEDSQSMRILRHLQNGNTVSSFEAYERFHVTRLSAVIKILKNDGYAIESEWEQNEDGRKNYKRYWLKGVEA